MRKIHIGDGGQDYFVIPVENSFAAELVGSGALYVCGDDPGDHDLHLTPDHDHSWEDLEKMLIGIGSALVAIGAMPSPDGMVAITTNGTTRVIPADEPVFLLRGQDMYAADTVRFWTGMVEGTADAAIVEEATRHAEKMEAWPVKKVPDLPGQHVPIDEHLPEQPAREGQGDHKGLPVQGYAPTQSQAAIDLVNEGKILEERVLRYIDKIGRTEAALLPDFGIAQVQDIEHNARYLEAGRTDVQKGFMMVFRSVFQPNGSRISLPDDL